MKKKIFKVSIILMCILTMTMSPFFVIGSSLVSYAAEARSTNHQNVEFEAYFKDKEGREVTTLETSGEETFLYLRVHVKKEGYFNGQVTIGNSNFTLKETDSKQVRKIENNTIYLNQINVGTTEEIKVAIQPIQEENFTIGLLDMTSEINMRGIYRDKTEKDITIQANRKLQLGRIENNTDENVLNELKVITNKLVQIDGQEKRMVQFSYRLGLKENRYPMKEIHARIELPTSQEVHKVEYLNNMTAIDMQCQDGTIELSLKNEPTAEGKVMWKEQGNEEVILTCLYDKEIVLNEAAAVAHEKVTFYNGKEIQAENQLTIGEEELDSVIRLQASNSEETMYKGKLYAGINRPYQSSTFVQIHFAKVVPEIIVTEAASQYVVEDAEQEASVTYQKTVMKKEQFDQLFGQNGEITIYNQANEVVGTINHSTPMDEEGNLTISYEGKDVKMLRIQTTAPQAEGTFEMKHSKMIEANGNNVKRATGLKNKITVQYEEQVEQETETSIALEETVTKATIEVNKQELSTVVANSVEIKAVLASNHEKYDLYQNPQIDIELPEQVENIEISGMDLLYENELRIRDYNVTGRTIHVFLEGEQKQYKEDVVAGATIVINANIKLNRRVATQDAAIQMTYTNQKAVQYEEGEVGRTSQPIKVVAPTDMTAIHSVPGLQVETLGEEESKQILLARGAEAKTLEAQIEVINNHVDAFEEVKILGDFPTDTNQADNMGIQITEGITLEGVENAKVYYSENAQATAEVEKPENAWQETLTDATKVEKYLILVPELEVQNSVKGSYEYQVPANLEYNQNAKTGYEVTYSNRATKVENNVKATTIEMETGVGAKLETKLVATRNGKEIKDAVKNGEVIRYQIQVSNVGTEEAKDVTLTAQVPEGTTRVVPEENYEYTGTSYYQELSDKTYEAKIDSIKPGEVVTKQYEVRVNSEVAENTTLSNIAKIMYGDVNKSSEEIQNKTAKGEIRVTVKRVTDRRVGLYTGGTVQYFAIVENISNEKQENVKVRTNLPNGLKVDRLSLITGMRKVEGPFYDTGDEYDITDQVEEMMTMNETVQSEVIEYQNEIKIDTLEPGEAKVFSYDMLIQDSNDVDFSVSVVNGEEQYESNPWEDQVNDVKVAISMTANTSDQYVKAGDTLTYTIKVENQVDANTQGLTVKDSIPSQLAIQKITVDGTTVEGFKGNQIQLPITLGPKATSTIEIETLVNYSQARSQAEAIMNVAYAEVLGKQIATTTEMNHIIEANRDVTGGDDGNSGDDTANDIDNNDIAKGNKMITGVAWYDENANGQKDPNEKLLSNIKVRLLNTQSNHLVKDQNGRVLETTTNDNGVYVLDRIGNGEYIVIFDYDTVQYTLTKYKAEGVLEAVNSNVIRSELLIEGNKEQVAATDILVIDNHNISNINMGLIKLQNFDLKLDKFVNRILIQDANGTTVREYTNETMAKVELDAKRINGSTVIIEYKINVTNNGEVEGYAKKIADYASSELKFSSELNKDWYQVGNVLYTASLANEKIKAGETKTVTLTLTKAMTENSTGLISNTAEIAEDYNELGIPDSNSVPGNRLKEENDFGAADVLLSIRTGGVVYYITIAIVVLAILGVTAVVIIKKKKNNLKEEI